MIDVYEKALSRKELMKLDMNALRAVCKKIHITPEPVKIRMVNRILGFLKNKFNSGDLYFSYQVMSDEEKEKIRAAKVEQKKKSEKKKKVKSETKQKINKLNKKLEELGG